MSIPNRFLTEHHRAQIFFVQSLGTVSLGTAHLGIGKLNIVLGLHEQGFTSRVLVSFGYWADAGFTARLPKLQLPGKRLLTYVKRPGTKEKA
ncbi:hypothetical protein GCM10009425_33350 [Pseudomonas asuensis]|uniref:Uncharacterized protein n=1 Tax=Pseudomonas asuensis TaxID=1825787 RepID=A0ABQ2GY96_9PSED|nr:hypothetical protein [Pseudomonas asuensis]GGM19826.1 hypothetical protein GCM10009425_33350 [Pseudomonas asuensis]